MAEVSCRPLAAEDWPDVKTIYEEGIAAGDATFERAAPSSWADWDAKHLPRCRLVALGNLGNDGRVIGWAALAPVSTRRVYAGVAEVSVYVAASARSQGVGTRLLTTLVQTSETNGLWTLQAGIFPENTASVRLHERCGFRIVGRRERLGQMSGRWRDVLLLERRSAAV